MKHPILHVMKSGSSEDNLRQIFRVFDIDNDGKIDLEEMKVIVKDLMKLKNNKKGNISIESLASSAFNDMDENEDGEISQEEFTKACLQRKMSSTMIALEIVKVFIET